MKIKPDHKSHSWPLVIASLAAIIVSFSVTAYILSAGTPKSTDTDSPSVQGTTTSAIQVQKASLKVNDRGNHKATVLLTIPEKTQIAGMEIYVKQRGGVKITGVECTDVFTCLDTVISEDRIEIIAIREPDDADSFFKGIIPVANITYDAPSPGYLEINGPESETSTVFPTGIPINLLTGNIGLFELGH